MANSKIITRLSIINLFLITALISCSKKNDGGSADPAPLNLLSGPAGKVWQLNDYTFGLSSGLCDCVKKHNHLALNTDGTYATSTLKCKSDTSLYTDVLGTSGQWSLSADNVTLNIGSNKYKLVSVNSTDLYIDQVSGGFVGNYHYIRVDGQTFLPFLSRSQQLSNINGKTWKYSKYTVRNVAQLLTAEQVATRLTFTTGGILTTSFTNTTFGQPVNGTWAFYDQYMGTLNMTSPAAGTSPTLNQNATILELTETSLIYQPYANNQTPVQGVYYMIPQ